MKLSKLERIQALERLSAQGYTKAQDELVLSLLNLNHGYFSDNDLKPEDFGETPQERFDILIAYGDLSNAPARSKVMDCLNGFGMHQEISKLEDIVGRSFPSLLKWIAQGDFSLVQGIFDVLQRQMNKGEETILKVKDVHNLFQLYKIFVSPTLNEFNQMVESVLRDIGV